MWEQILTDLGSIFIILVLLAFAIVGTNKK